LPLSFPVLIDTVSLRRIGVCTLDIFFSQADLKVRLYVCHVRVV